jgi:hypothetical protein
VFITIYYDFSGTVNQQVKTRDEKQFQFIGSLLPDKEGLSVDNHGGMPSVFRVSLLEGSGLNASEPLKVLYGEGYPGWMFHGKLYLAAHCTADDDEIKRRLKHHVLARERVDQITRELEAFRTLPIVDRDARERIPESVRLFVWQRDHGRCSECRGRYLLEFDHIVSVELGGRSTERNIRLLCEPCHRKKDGGTITTAFA